MVQWYPVNLPLARNTRARRRYVEFARVLQRDLRYVASAQKILEHRAQLLEEMKSMQELHLSEFRASSLVLADLALNGWAFRITRTADVFAAPPTLSQDRDVTKAAIRSQELIRRDAQLRKPSVLAFVQSMEKRRLFEKRFVSVFSLMRDGSELATQLEQSRDSPANGDGTIDIIKPYIQFVDSKTRCEHTGLRLMSVWRYFRHTWTNQYTSVPGRSMLLLIRDAAGPHHPIMGIASIASPIIQISERDKWLGWHPETLLERLQKEPTAKMARWLSETVDTAIDEIYKTDFLSEKRITRWRLSRPKKEDIEALRTYAQEQKKRHRRYANRSDFESKEKPTRRHWIKQARTPLFKSKRAQALADLLDMRLSLQSQFSSGFSAKKLKAYVDTADGRRIVAKVARKAKADRVGVAMADISVCGAVQPYNAILAGKLVSALAASPAVVAEYRRRYEESPSQIASSMAGRSIVRDPALVYVGTTSLYGNGSSQYNRIRVPASLLGGEPNASLRFEKLGDSESFGTAHFSNETVDALERYLRQAANGERVNSIFGEGVSPRLRKVRAGLEQLGYPADALMQHGRRRSVYGVLLAKNARDYLLGIAQQPQYLFSLGQRNSTDAIVSWWRHRWLSARIHSDSVLQQVAQHDHVHPIRHGARVPQLSKESDTNADGA